MLKIIHDVDQFVAEALDEDSLWQALSNTPDMNHVEIQYKYGKYTAEVFFQNRSGSSIFAKGEDVDRVISMAKCLKEIERLL